MQTLFQATPLWWLPFKSQIRSQIWKLDWSDSQECKDCGVTVSEEINFKYTYHIVCAQFMQPLFMKLLTRRASSVYCTYARHKCNTSKFSFYKSVVATNILNRPENFVNTWEQHCLLSLICFHNPFSSASTDEVERICYFSAPGRHFMTLSQALTAFASNVFLTTVQLFLTKC